MDAITIGETAGKVWQHLAKEGPTPIKNLPKMIGADLTLTHLAVGWLSREGKAMFVNKGKDLAVSLTEAELKTLGS